MLSLLLHLWLLWLLPQSGQDTQRSSIDVLHLRLEKVSAQKISTKVPAKTVHAPVKQPTAAPEHAAPVSTKPDPKATAETVSHSTPTLPVIAEPESALNESEKNTGLTAALSPATSKGDTEEKYQKIKAQVSASLSRHFQYPMLAQRRGWQGEVVLAFNLLSDGRIDNAHVTHSSGYAVLDRAALNALGKVKRIDLAPQTETFMQLPVIYQLHEG